ncbi:uncharacterized protein [Procambarus clarkii]|uniref:uncharacterized protein isoform X2 n=1 Tax=Procambarus clarkii TaxID=6728 RepID=UPI001E676247|nr:zinc finger and BTB domain-containing protein 5-like isoform X2 [Procambarus clarkii]
MADQTIFLRWNDHHNCILRMLSNIRKKEQYCDATIMCEGRFFPVHRIVLATCSSYFEDIFAKLNCNHPMIVLMDTKSAYLEVLLSYMYGGEIGILERNLADVLRTASALKVKGLFEHTVSNADVEVNREVKIPKPHSNIQYNLKSNMINVIPASDQQEEESNNEIIDCDSQHTEVKQLTQMKLPRQGPSSSVVVKDNSPRQSSSTSFAIEDNLPRHCPSVAVAIEDNSPRQGPSPSVAIKDAFKINGNFKDSMQDSPGMCILPNLDMSLVGSHTHTQSLEEMLPVDSIADGENSHEDLVLWREHTSLKPQNKVNMRQTLAGSDVDPADESIMEEIDLKNESGELCPQAKIDGDCIHCREICDSNYANSTLKDKNEIPVGTFFQENKIPHDNYPENEGEIQLFKDDLHLSASVTYIINEHQDNDMCVTKSSMAVQNSNTTQDTTNLQRTEESSGSESSVNAHAIETDNAVNHCSYEKNEIRTINKFNSNVHNKKSVPLALKRLNVSWYTNSVTASNTSPSRASVPIEQIKGQSKIIKMQTNSSGSRSQSAAIYGSQIGRNPEQKNSKEVTLLETSLNNYRTRSRKVVANAEKKPKIPENASLDYDKSQEDFRCSSQNSLGLNSKRKCSGP